MEYIALIIVLVSLLYSMKPTQCQLHEQHNWERDKFKEEASQTFNLVLHKYNSRIRPPRAYIDVIVHITLNHIRDFDLRKQELQTVLDINMSWNDSRLEWTASKVKQIIVNESIIWTPDIVFTNAVAPSRSLYPSALKINSTGNVQWARKEEVTTFCKTQENEVTQTCTISLGFLSNSKNDQTDRFFDQSSSFQVRNNFTNHEWVINSDDVDKIDRNDTEGHITNMDVIIQLERRESATSSWTTPRPETQGCDQKANSDSSASALTYPNLASLLVICLVISVAHAGLGSRR